MTVRVIVDCDRCKQSRLSFAEDIGVIVNGELRLAAAHLAKIEIADPWKIKGKRVMCGACVAFDRGDPPLTL